MRPANNDELANWDQLIADNPDGGNVLQLKAFGQTKARHGWHSRFFIQESGNQKLAVLALARTIQLLGEFWYLPKGPGVADAINLNAFLNDVRKLDQPPFAVRMDPELTQRQLTTSAATKLGLVKSPRDIQYNVNTVIVDLAPSEDDMLASFKQKTRYNVRLAAKKGVEVKAVSTNQQTIDTMYQLYATTTKRANVYLRSKSYFSDFWQLHSDSSTGQQFFASYQGQVLAGAYVTFVGNKALYKDGGSIREHTELQAPYALQWEIMRWLKAKGITEYDLHGTPPAARADDRTHPLAGLARFKTGFNQQITEFAGTYDLPIDQAKYQRWVQFGERLATGYQSRIRGRLFY